MYQEFLVTNVHTDIKSKTILIELSSNVDKRSINESSIQVINRKTRKNAEYSFSIDNRTILVELVEWPNPNEEYVLKVEKIVNVVGDKLETDFNKKIAFTSSISSIIEITTPAFNEVIEDLIVAWIEKIKNPKDPLINRYYIEVAEDINFYHLIQKSEVTEANSIKLSKPKNGQYFVRCRAQKEEEYGFWSEIVSFIVGDEQKDPDNVLEEEDECDEPIFVDSMKILSTPKNGETPDSIIIEFDCNIDSDFLDNIILIRRDY